MKATGPTQESLAEALDMTQGGVPHWLAGTRHPKLEDIHRIAAILEGVGSEITQGASANETSRTLAAMDDRRPPKASAKSLTIVETLTLARRNELTADDWVLLDRLAVRMRKK